MENTIKLAKYQECLTSAPLGQIEVMLTPCLSGKSVETGPPQAAATYLRVRHEPMAKSDPLLDRHIPDTPAASMGSYCTVVFRMSRSCLLFGL